jgi:hypothetical protein
MTTAASSSKSRQFEKTWAKLEADHGWAITEGVIDNRSIAASRLVYAWQDYDNRRATEFRQRHGLEQLVAGAANDWDAILRLRQWAFTRIKSGTPSVPSTDPFHIMAASQAGGTFWCTYYAYLFVAACGAMGFCARHLGVDAERDKTGQGTHHGVADVWVNTFRKWAAVDPMYDSHYELNGVPLNAEEVGQRWRAHKGAGIEARVGPERQLVARARPAVPGDHESRAYYWCYIDAESDVFHRRASLWPNPVVFLIDDERESRTWYQGQPPDAAPHGRYANGSFIQTRRSEDAYPDLNCTRIDLEPAGLPGSCNATFYSHCAPNFSHYTVRAGGREFRTESANFAWRLHPGGNTLEVHAVNLAGHAGPPSKVEIHVEPDSRRKAEWPKAAG